MRRILYIDDDAGLCRLVSRDLARHGFEVVTEPDGEAGERRLAAEPGGFAAVCVDHYMPGRDGLETLSRLRAIPGAPPIIYVTGSEEGRVAIAALRAGAADYVIKEASAEFFHLLRAALDSTIERESLRREREQTMEELRAERDRAEELARQSKALLQEVNHRVANSLQLIAALTQLQETAVTDAGARGALAEVRNRVYAVAQVHRRLYTSDDVRLVVLDDYIAALMEDIRRSVEIRAGEAAGGADAASPFTFELHLDPLAVPTDTAVSVGVVVAELVTNAVKYAYPGSGGPIRIGLQAKDGEAVLSVEDDGVGMGATTGTGTGVGQRIINAIATGIKGRVERQERAVGTRINLVFPLD